MAKVQEKKGADAKEQAGQETPSESAGGNGREHPNNETKGADNKRLDVWSTGKFPLKLGVAYPQDDGSLKVFLNAMPRENVVVISKSNGKQ